MKKELKSNPNAQDFGLVFKKLKEAMKDQEVSANLSETEYFEIQDSIKVLEEIQRAADTTSYSYFTRS